MKGLGPAETPVAGRGTITLKFEFDGKTYLHQLRNTLHVPEGSNCLLSLGRYDHSGGKVEFEKGMCWLQKNGMRGRVTNVEDCTFSPPQGQSCEAEGERTSLQRNSPGISGINDTATSLTCEACIQAKQARQPFSKEAEHRSVVAGLSWHCRHFSVNPLKTTFLETLIFLVSLSQYRTDFDPSLNPTNTIFLDFGGPHTSHTNLSGGKQHQRFSLHPST